jgi:hypothetical protein
MRQWYMATNSSFRNTGQVAGLDRAFDGPSILRLTPRQLSNTNPDPGCTIPEISTTANFEFNFTGGYITIPKDRMTKRSHIVL